MKTITKTILLSLCALATLSCSKYKYEEVKGDLTATRIYTLDNGLKVYLSVNSEKPRIQTYIAVRTGSKNDPAETTGLAHYLEHLMFKGTKLFGVNDTTAEAPLLADIEQRYEQYRKLTDPEQRRIAYHEIDSVSQLAAKYFIPNEYDKLMSVIGAEGTNAYTSSDVTCYTEDIPSNQVDNWAKIQADRFQNMVIRGFHTELEAVYEEYNINLTRDANKMYHALCAKLMPTHPYGTQTTIGTQEHLKNPSITNIKNYFEKWYVPNNVAICMAGDFDPDEVIKTIDKYFGQWKPGADVAQPTFDAQPEIVQPVDTTVVGQEAESIWLGWRFDPAASLQVDTLQMIEQLLSNGTAGLIDLDLNQQLKVQEASAETDANQDATFFLLAGVPKEGQSLDEVRQLMLAELDKLKQGDFSDDLLPSVVNNMKLRLYTMLESNRARANMFVESFINGTPWQQQVEAISRVEGMTKEQIVAFANRHFADNYVAVYKRQGEDLTQKKIDKPQITPIPTNRDQMSAFVEAIQNAEVMPIEPKFVDLKGDLTRGETQSGLPYVYVQNTENGRFQLTMRYEFGEEAELKYYYAADLLDYVGTDSLSAEQIKQQFYKLACRYNVNVGARTINVSLSGLGESMPEALALLEHLLGHAKADPQAYANYVAMIAKQRADSKLDQRSNFNALVRYGLYGPYNSTRNVLSTKQLAQTDPQELLDMLKTLADYEHTLLYYGPLTTGELSDVISQAHHTAAQLKPVPQNRHYELQPTPENEILLAPYDAKNIYMRMYHNEMRPWNAEEAPVIALFNEYYGGGMNSIVFQELREARGLAYNAYASYVEPYYEGEPEYYFTHIITQNDKMMDCVNHFHTLLDSIPESEAAFQIAKEAVRARLASLRTTKFGLINAWIDARDLGIDYDINQKIYGALPALTLSDIVDFEKSQMAGKTYRYIILGNERDLDLASLLKYGTLRKVTTEEIFGY